MNESNSILAQLSQPGKRSIAVLIDPEKCTDDNALKSLLEKSAFAKIDFLFIGGSTVTRKEFDKAINLIRSLTKIPLVIFPGSAQQISSKADAILYLSLLSGRNPDFLIDRLTKLPVKNCLYAILKESFTLVPPGFVTVTGAPLGMNTV